MPSTSAGRIVKSKRNSKLTQHQKNHRWESFTSKVSKLHSLDPLRKVRRHDLDNEDLSASTSYLRNGLDKWSELNLSKNFTSFRREVAPLTDSLPQILHHQDKLMDILYSYISKNEKESLEPLLDILIAFAHDLGVRFEKHYPRALALIVGVAQSPASRDAEVIEYTFAALAFLFKYLARLLAPDLRATYDAVAPLLGRSKVPGHVARFAAEAMSFLVKKAAAPSQREADALGKFVEHVRADLTSQRETRQFGLYTQGVMYMFAESLKSAGHTIHSTAPETLAAIIKVVPNEELGEEGKSVWTDVICGMLTSVVHHSTNETFGAVEKTIVDETLAALDDTRTKEMPWRMSMFVRFFGVIAGVRRGNRLADWPSIIKALSKALATLSSAKEQVLALPGSLVWQHIIVNTAIVWCQAPMDALIPSISDFMSTMTKEPLMRYYIPFCSYFADLNSERFRSLFQKHFQRFIMAHWSDPDNEEMLCILLPHMVESGSLPAGTEKESCTLPQSWQDQIVSKFERLEITPFPERGAYDKDPKEWRDKCLPKYSALLQVLESTSVHPSTNARIAELLLRKLKLALRPSSSLATDEANFIVSHGFRAYLRMTKASSTLDMSLSPLLRAATPRFCRLIGFLEALRDYESEVSVAKNSSSDESGESSESSKAEVDPLVQSLTSNLQAPSHELRLVSLQILATLETTPDQKSALAIMMQVEQSPLDLQHARNMSVHIRKLGQIYGHLGQGSWLQQAIPAFLFGMMTVKLSPVWDDAVEAMKIIAENKTGEEIIANLAFEWLDVPSARWGEGAGQPMRSNHQPLTDFECLNYMKLQKTAALTTRVISEGAEVLLEKFDDGHEMASVLPDNARTRALKVFSALPASAEKRSRRLVPYLLAWNDVVESPEEEDDDEEEEEEEEGKKQEEGKAPEGGWSLVDRKALIGVFSQFINPRVLFQSQKVYDVLLNLVANGDIEIQKAALKAILAWKQEGLKPYQESLEYLLDEARFKNELTVLFQGDNKIQPGHRAELMPVLLRLLYGRSISKKGASSGKHGLHNTRLAVIRQLDVEDMGVFLHIALGKLVDIRVLEGNSVREATFANEALPVRKQVGLLNMVESIINELGTSVIEYMETIVNAVLYCLIEACRQLKDGEEEDAEEETFSTENKSLYKVARTTALKCLSKLFTNAPAFDWTAYREAIVHEVISPRIDKLAAETTQGISATWKLLATWSVLPKPALFLAVDDRILPRIMDCLSLVKAKDEVKVFALTIVRNLVKLAVAPVEESECNEQIKSELLDPNVDLILKQVDDLLRNQPDIGRDLLETAIEAVVDLAPLVENSKNARDVVDICTFLLQQPSRKVSPKIKGSILVILKNFIALDSIQSSDELKAKVYATIGPLFGYFKDMQNRRTLAEVLQVFAAHEPWAQEVADLCSDLNSYVERRLDEPDYNRRLSAFNVISKDGESRFTIDQWIPLLHNMVFFICQDEEFGVLSTNSADGITKFVEAAAAGWEGPEHGRYVELLSTVILPAIYAGAREQSETVRREHSRLFAALITRLGSKWAPISDLTVLVPQSEEETEHAFFFHILSPAVSKQLQAVHLLQQANEKTPLQSKNISQFFIPLLEHFIFDRPEGTDDQGLSAQTTTAITSMAISLEWQQYRAILRRYISFVESKPDHQKQVIRLLEKLVDTLATAQEEKMAASDAMEVDGEKVLASKRRKLAVTLPNQEKLTDEITNGGLPPLLKHLHDKDETTVSERVPVAIIIVKLLKLLSVDVLDSKLPGVLTDISHILRSKAWDSRERARDTLAHIARILGPSKFGFVVKELRGALTRGYQLHVLSYTLHSILIKVIPAFQQGDLDYCIPQMVGIVMDDIFGVTGQEKDAEDYSSQVKEVKSSKSQDSLELITKNASIVHLGALIEPLQAMLLEKLDLRMVRKIDDLLARITSGLLQNPAAESRDTLVFAYEVIQDVYKRTEQTQKEQPKMDPMIRRYLVQKGAKKSDRGLTTKHTHKLVRFAIDVLRSILRKHDSLRTAANIAGFLPIIGDAVVAGEEEVKTAAFKLLTVLVKVPFKTDESANLYKVTAKEAAKTISQSPSTGTDVCQAALKLISVVLRDRREIAIKDAAIDMLLNKLKDDLTEPLYRHVTFNFLRCVLDRKIETAVVYDTLDYVGTVMITNDDKDTRDLARGAFFQFLRDYPQKKNRWAKQLTFIVANLKYEREGGRLSVMEVIHLLLMKSADDFVQEVAATCFIPLIFVLANDDSEKCRLAAGKLVEEIFKRADQDHTKKFLTLLRSWINQEDNQAVLKLALQAFGYYFDGRESSPKDKKDVDLVVDKVNDVLSEEDDWELVNAALIVVQVLVAKHPQKVLAADSQTLWTEVRECLSHANPHVRLTAIKTLSMYLADFASHTRSDTTTPTGSHGLVLAPSDVSDLVRLSLGILTAQEVEESLAEEAARVLTFLGNYLEPDDLSKPEGEVEDEESEAEEDATTTSPDKKPRTTGLRYLFWKLSTIIRKEVPPKAQFLIPKRTAIALLTHFVSTTAKTSLLPSTKTILRPLRNLTDPSIPTPWSVDEVLKTQYEDIKTRAAEIMDVLQSKLGTAEYTSQLLGVGQYMRDRRMKRSGKRKIEAVSAPEKFGRDKRKKFEKKKERRKVRGQEHRDLRKGY